jgi:hypothetical protein
MVFRVMPDMVKGLGLWAGKCVGCAYKVMEVAISSSSLRLSSVVGYLELPLSATTTHSSMRTHNRGFELHVFTFPKHEYQESCESLSIVAHLPHRYGNMVSRRSLQPMRRH